MLEKFKSFPAPLQKQILIRLVGFIIGIVAILVMLINNARWQLFFPAVMISIYFLIASVSLFFRCAEGRYVTLHGICKVIERSSFRKRIKALHIESEGRHIKLIPHQSSALIKEGDTVTIYLADNASVYEVDQEMVLCDIITYRKGALANGSKAAV